MNSNGKRIRPPKWMDNLLLWYCDPQFIDEIQGDLYEAFYMRYHEKGLRHARWFYVLDVLRSFSYRTLNKKKRMPGNITLLRSYFTFTLRKARRRKLITFINIAGLSVGLASALLIYLFVTHELSFDRFHEKADRIYRVYCAYSDPGEAVNKFASTPPVFAAAVKQEIEGVEEIVRLYSYNIDALIQNKDQAFNEKNVCRVDDGFFSIFTACFLAGDPATALKELHSVVLSQSAAIRYFGSVEKAIDQFLNIELHGKETWKVTAVVEDFPSNAHFTFNVLLSIDKTQERYYPDNWLSHHPATYVLLREGVDPQDVQNSIRSLTEKTLEPIYERRLGKSYSVHKQAGGLQEYRLQPLARVHLYSADLGEEEGNIVEVYLFGVIGIMLVLIACFNYINLSTARWAWEARGAGIRKVLGATGRQLKSLFLIESMGAMFISAIVALVAAQAVLVWDNSLVHYFIPLRQLTSEAVLFLLMLTVFAGLLSGMIPARLVGRFDPARVLKGQLVKGAKGSRLRQVLVVMQFVGSMGLIMCTLLITRQLNFIYSKSLGFNKENLLVIQNVDKLGNRKSTLKQAVQEEPFVVSASLCYNTLGAPYNNAAFTPVELIEQGRKDLTVGIPVYIADQDYLPTLEVDLIYGHPFPPDLARKNQQIILNREALRSVGWQDRQEKDLIGKMIDVNGLRYELAGIVEDYHFTSLHENLGPMAILSHYYQDYEFLMLRIRPGTHKQAVEKLSIFWKTFAPDVPFAYAFVDTNLAHLYAREQHITRLFESFATLAIFIACLGLLGLTLFSAERRVKEIGVRKVMGASVRNIVFMLSQDTLRLILLAFVLATPLAWYMIDHWLENFAYRVSISASPFLISGGLTFVLALVTISIHAIKAARVNPAHSLRDE